MSQKHKSGQLKVSPSDRAQLLTGKERIQSDMKSVQQAMESNQTAYEFSSDLSTGKDNFDQQSVDLSHKSINSVEMELFDTDYLRERFVLPKSKNKDDDNDSMGFIEQRFLSTKIRASETPDETLTEFLNVLASQDLQEDPTQYGIDETGCTKFLCIRNMKLRRLLFNNPLLDYLNEVNDCEAISDARKWELWGNSFISTNTREQEYKSSVKELKERYGDNEQFVKLIPLRRKSATAKIIYRVISQDDIARWHNTFKSFANFAKAINLLRSWSFICKNRQWCSHFIFPFGPDCLYMEIDKDHVFKNNYMSGAGLIMFSMVQRSTSPEDVRLVFTKLHDRFLNPNNPFNVIAQQLEGREHDISYYIDLFKQDVHAGKINSPYDKSDDDSFIKNSLQDGSTVYLPFKRHRVFDQITEDFKSILSLDNQLNQNDLFQALSFIGTLNLVVYYQETCQKLLELCHVESNIDMVVECNHNARNNLRRLSADSQRENAGLLGLTVNTMIKTYLLKIFFNLNEHSMLDKQEYEYIMDIIEHEFSLDKRLKQDCSFDKCCKLSHIESLEQQETTSDKVKVSFAALHQCFLQEFNTSLRNILTMHSLYTSSIGLTPVKKTRSYRYVLSDTLVKCLVLSTVKKDSQLMSLNEFLAELHTKYHLVIGPNEAQKTKIDANSDSKNKDEAKFIANVNAFKEQLMRLGFLVELSDTAAYVKNPYLK